MSEEKWKSATGHAIASHETDRPHHPAEGMEFTQVTKQTENVSCDDLSNMDVIKCVTWCNRYYGGEVRHHIDCPYYPESMTKILDDTEAVNNKLLWVLKKVIPIVDDKRIIDLGVVRDAENQGYQERIIMARRELAETTELINDINAAIAAAEKGVN